MVGTSISLEKSYTRLSGLPDPRSVRPPAVLEESLKVVQRRFAQSRCYEYALEQLRSIRQDLTVQQIRDPLAAAVYETSCRIAIESDDMHEFNVAQVHVRQLHAAGFHAENAAEFCAYHILYSATVPPPELRHGQVQDILTSLNPAALRHPFISQAIRLHVAYDTSDFHDFFRLWPNLHNLGVHFADRVVPEMRRLALDASVVAFSPALSLERLGEILGLGRDCDKVRAYLMGWHGLPSDSFELDEAGRQLLRTVDARRTLRCRRSGSRAHIPGPPRQDGSPLLLIAR